MLAIFSLSDRHFCTFPFAESISWRVVVLLIHEYSSRLPRLHGLHTYNKFSCAASIFFFTPSEYINLLARFIYSPAHCRSYRKQRSPDRLESTYIKSCILTRSNVSRISFFPSSVCASCLRFLPNLKAGQAGSGGQFSEFRISNENYVMVWGHLLISNAWCMTGPFPFGSLVVCVWSGFEEVSLMIVEDYSFRSNILIRFFESCI